MEVNTENNKRKTKQFIMRIWQTLCKYSLVLGMVHDPIDIYRTPKEKNEDTVRDTCVCFMSFYCII